MRGRLAPQLQVSHLVSDEKNHFCQIHNHHHEIIGYVKIEFVGGIRLGAFLLDLGSSYLHSVFLSDWSGGQPLLGR